MDPLLKLLHDNAALKPAQLAVMLNTTEGDLAATIKAYEADPVILGYRTVLNEETAKSFPFLSKITETRIAEARDDRFFASFNLGERTYRTLWEENRKFGNAYQLAYIVRAVTPGTFALPAVNVSDMYAPRVYARSAMGSLTVAPR